MSAGFIVKDCETGTPMFLSRYSDSPLVLTMDCRRVTLFATRTRALAAIRRTNRYRVVKRMTSWSTKFKLVALSPEPKR